uniref:Phospholipase A2 n=1 Tax=Naja naja TaxID=35670 RepID=A0A8C6YDK5_NAJNA
MPPFSGDSGQLTIIGAQPNVLNNSLHSIVYACLLLGLFGPQVAFLQSQLIAPNNLGSSIYLPQEDGRLINQSDCYVSLRLPSSSFVTARTKTISNCTNPVWNETFFFRIQNMAKNILEITIYDEDSPFNDEELYRVTFDIANLQFEERVCKHFELNKEVGYSTNECKFSEMWLIFNCSLHYIISLLFTIAFDWLLHRVISQKLFPLETQKSLDMRLGFDLCPEEQDFICKRKKYVAAALKNVLRLEGELHDNEVPIVALMTTAGGVRSMTAMYGSLLGLQKLNLLHCISYITGTLNAATLAMINLFRDPYWSHKNLEGTIMDVRKQVMKNKLCCFSGENLKYYEKEMWNRHDEGYKLTFADLWGLILESMFNDKPDPHKLSDQRQAINLGQNPLPIYLALNVKKRYSTLDFKEWVEFTPYEVGFLKYGAFINAEDFGSEFYMGHLMKKIPESRLCFIQGMWSNVYSQSLLDALYLAECSEDFWHRWTRPRMYEIEDIPPWLPKRPYVQPTRLFIPNGSVSDVIRDVVTVRPVVACYSNFIKGLQFNNKYLENNSFSMWKDTVLDCSPNHLTESEEYLELVDTAFFINTSCPPLLRPERQVDIIIHLNYSGGSQALPLDLSTRYYHDQGIPFPKAVLTEEDKKQLKECYLFDDAESPKAPILLYFPLVCDTFQKYKSPGIERSPNEMDDGYADVTSTIFSPYATGMLQYSEENFNKLINLTDYNILNNEHMILQALRTAIERKKQQNLRSSF